jgi:hypothetical protein
MHIKIWSALAVGPLKWRGAALRDFDGSAGPIPTVRRTVGGGEREHVTLAQPGRPPGGASTTTWMWERSRDTLFSPGPRDAGSGHARSTAPIPAGAGGAPSPQGLHCDAWSLLEDPEVALGALSADSAPPPRHICNCLRWTRGSALAAGLRGAGNDGAGARCGRHLRMDFGYAGTARQGNARPLAYFCSRGAEACGTSPARWR